MTPNGPAHIHAVYGDFEITVEVESDRTMAISRSVRYVGTLGRAT